MARKREKNYDLPPMIRRRIQKSGRIFYYFDTGAKPRREIPLGPNLVDALRKWSELFVLSGAGDQTPESIQLKHVWERYLKDELKSRSQNTQRDYLRQVKHLLHFFAGADLDQIEPQHISQYLKWRREAPVQANREKALFSTLFNHARSWGMTRSANPCKGVKGYKETGRRLYIEDDVYQYVLQNADPILRRYINLLYLTGQRSADVFSMSIYDLSETAIVFEQSKTGQKLRMNLRRDDGQDYELGTLIDELLALRKNTNAKVDQLFVDQEGNEVTYSMMSQRFRRLRKKLVVQLKSDGNEKMAHAIAVYQLRDLRGKAGTDTAIASGDIRTAQKQLGHKNLAMTEHYIKNRRGDRVNPTK